jgi:regulator of Ty1 transposition protein 103
MAPTSNLPAWCPARRRIQNRWYNASIPPKSPPSNSSITELDRARGGHKKAALGGSLFSSSASSAPPEYQAILSHQAQITKSEVLSKPTVLGALAEYDKQSNPAAPIPTAPVHAARLSALLKTLANAEGAVAESIKARRALVEGLEKIFTRNKEQLAKEEAQLADINSKKITTEAKKREVEDGILRGLANNDDLEPERPDAEPLTPPMPPVESITPIGTPKGFVTTTGADVFKEEPNNFAEPEPPSFEQLPARLLDTAGDGLKREDETNGEGVEPVVKRRKVVNNVGVDDYAEFADGAVSIDADVEAML